MKKKELLQMLEDLQSQVAFQEDTLQGLQAALSSQQQDLLVVQRQMQLLKERQDEQAAALDDARPRGSEAPPPHY